MEKSGIRRIALVPFTRTVADMPPEDFVAMLQERCHATGLVCGYNYTFGAGALRTPEMLETLCASRGMTVSVLDPVLVDGSPVSSTRVRQLVEEGDFPAVSRMLGRTYALLGTVVKNRGNGRKMGFPTANIPYDEVKEHALPPEGVYATETLVDGVLWPSVTNIGSNPTVGGETVTVETHVSGFEGNLYGKAIRVGFLGRLRGDRKFESLDALARQIASDAAQAEGIYARCHGKG